MSVGLVFVGAQVNSAPNKPGTPVQIEGDAHRHRVVVSSIDTSRLLCESHGSAVEEGIFADVACAAVHHVLNIVVSHRAVVVGGWEKLFRASP